MTLHVPNSNIDLYPGDVIRIERFSMTSWIVQYGWYTWGGDRPVCGWSLRDTKTGNVKPLQETDLIDIYLVSHAPASDSETVTLTKYHSSTVYRLGQLLYFTIGTVYQAAEDFTSSGEYETDAENLAADISAGKLVTIN